MKGMPSLSIFASLWRRVRNSATPDTSSTPSRQDRARSAEVAASATTDRIRRVVQASRVQTNLPEKTAPQSPEPPPPPTPSQTSGPQEQTRQLWGREFTITERGLSQEQVAEFVEELLSRNRNLEEQGAPAAISNYVQKLMGELQNVEESIQSQARRDAETEAAKITAEASRQAQEAIAQARAEAIKLAQREAEGILAQARKKAEIADGQIRIQAQLMLSKVREQIEVRIQQEGETAYNRLLASLTGMHQEVQRVESEWKQERAQLWRGDDVKLALGATSLSALPVIQEALTPTMEQPDLEAGEPTPTSDVIPPQEEQPDLEAGEPTPTSDVIPPQEEQPDLEAGEPTPTSDVIPPQEEQPDLEAGEPTPTSDVIPPQEEQPDLEAGEPTPTSDVIPPQEEPPEEAEETPAP